MAKKKPPVIKTNVALEALTIEYLPVESIQPNEYNPNRMSEKDFELLLRSMREDGFTQPIIVHRTTRKIVDGEHRWRAAQAIGLKMIPVVRVPMEAAQARIATLRHNRARGTEDIELATEVLRDLERLGALDWAADSLDLSDAELQRLLEDIPAPEALAKEQFSEAWVPGSVQGEADTDGRMVTSTPMGIDQSRLQERRLQDAKTAEEREAAIRDTKVFRLTLIFSGEEGETVRMGLGPQPAVTVLEFCKQKLGR